MESIANTLGLNWQGLLWHLVNFAVLLADKAVETFLEIRLRYPLKRCPEAGCGKPLEYDSSPHVPVGQRLFVPR